MDNDIESRDVKVRVVIEQSDPKTINAWRERMQEFGLVIDAANERSVDAHGQKKAIEKALVVKILDVDGRTDIVSGPNLRVGAAKATAYIPRKPKFF